MPNGNQRSGRLWQAKTNARAAHVVVHARDLVAHGPHKRGIEEQHGPFNAPKYFFSIIYFVFQISTNPTIR